MSLYQKYRPKDFDDLVGQQFIRKALTSALQKNKTVGAYLFCGSRGTGKTSVARIFAKAINCLQLKVDGNPCGNCQNCQAFADGTMMDIVEIDGASNNGVDHIRELIEKAWFQPSFGKFKVYIIDEVHMLSKPAFNALLKTLEEPPEHVKFILATTEFDKILETIVSRTQRYDFRKISESDIIGRLQVIAEKENIQTETPALELIAKLAKGGLRDAISLFEQYSVGGMLSYEFIRDNLSIVGQERLQQITDAVISNDILQLKVIFSQFKTESIEPRRLLEQYLYFLRESAFDAVQTSNFSRLIRIFEACTGAYSKIKDFPNGFLLLEMTLLGQMHIASEGIKENSKQIYEPAEVHVGNTFSAPARSGPSLVKKKSFPSISQIDVTSKPLLPETPPVAEDTVALSAPVVQVHASLPSFSFLELIKITKDTPKKGVLLSVLKTGTFDLAQDASRLTIFATSEYSRTQVDTPENRDFLSTVLRESFGIEPQIHFACVSSKGGAASFERALDAKMAGDIF